MRRGRSWWWMAAAGSKIGMMVVDEPESEVRRKGEEDRSGR